MSHVTLAQGVLRASCHVILRLVVRLIWYSSTLYSALSTVSLIFLFILLFFIFIFHVGWFDEKSHAYFREWGVRHFGREQSSHNNHTRVKQKLLTQKSLQKFLEPTRKPKVIYTDSSLEFGKACGDLSWNRCTSTPHRSETNGIAERAVRRIEEGASAMLLHYGLDEKWWADSMECYCCLRNIQDLFSDGEHLTNGDSANYSKDQ